MKAPRPSMYQRPSKPLFVAVPQQDHTARTVTAAPLPAPVSVDRSSECHVTPPDVAARMAALLGPLHGVDVL
ncbi:hypothetical protein, partial [Salmonella enterica]|uniref:hypothetical protein n=1 Tax=Salmonella enterica TaxID=28901 RepID=UPI003CFA9DDC